MKRIQNILVAVDTHFDEHPALPWGIRPAEHHQTRLKIVDALPDLSWFAKLGISDSGSTRHALAEQKSRKSDAIAEPVRDKGIDVTTQLLSGKTLLGEKHAQQIIIRRKSPCH